MVPALVGCNRCGYATRLLRKPGTSKRCPKCGAALLEMDYDELCALVRQRNAAERVRRRPAASWSRPRSGPRL